MSVGQRADLVHVSGDPANDLANRRLRQVMRGGVVRSPDELRAAIRRAGARPAPMHELSRVILVTLAGALATAAGGPVTPPTQETPQYFPGGVANAVGSVGCVRTLDGGVEALDLASGKPMWRSAAPSRALLVAREGAFLLEERGGRLQLSGYETRTGRHQGTWSVRFELPTWVSLAEPRADRRWTTFDVQARRNGMTLEVEYHVRQHLTLGVQPGPRTESEARGVIRFELQSGRVEHRPGDRLARDPWLEPAPVAGPRLDRFHARAADAAIMLGGPPPDVEGVLVVDDLRVGFERLAHGRGILVHRWSRAASASDRPLEIRADTDAIWSTLDRRHVALRRAHAQTLCDIHSLVSGARIATLAGPVDIAVIGGRLLWTARSGNEELALVASEVGSGRTLWRRTVWRAPPMGRPVP